MPAGKYEAYPQRAGKRLIWQGRQFSFFAAAARKDQL